MPVLSDTDMDPFIMFVPTIMGMYASAGAAYVYLVHQNKIVSYGLLVWFAVVLAITYCDFYIQSLEFSRNSLLDNLEGLLWYYASLFFPLAVLAVAWYKFAWFRNLFLEQMPSWILIAFQTYRVGGFLFLWIWAKGVVPNFAMEWSGCCDVFIGLTAYPLAYYVHRNGLRAAKVPVYVWTVIGILDFSVPFVLFFLNYLGVYAADTSMAIFMLFPASVIVLFNVVLAIFTHVLFLANMETLMEAAINGPLSIESSPRSKVGAEETSNDPNESMSKNTKLL